jgi:hypothetical protein
MKPRLFLLLASCGILLLLSTTSYADNSPKQEGAAKKPAETYWVPYRLSDVKHVVVRVKINGKGPFNFIVDTGAPAVYIGLEAGKQIGLNTKEEAWHTLDSFEIEGGPKLTQFKARVEDPFQLTGMNKINAPGMKYHGVLGYTMLARYVIEYDFTRNHLKWTKLDWTPPSPFGLGNLSKGASQEMKAMVGLSLFATSLMPRKADATYLYRGLVGIEVAQKEKRVIITKVLPQSPAEAAGLQVDDRIVEFRDKTIGSLADLEKLGQTLPAEQEVELVIERAGSEKTIRLTTARGF